jgi:tetratricopeptide (TPR) repeat protein
VVSVTVLTCPVCAAPLAPDRDRCAYCGSVVVIKTDHPRIDPHLLNKAVIDQHIAEYRRTVRRDPNDETAHYGLGVAYFNLGLLEEAADELTQAARLMPENPHIQTQLAVVLAEHAAAGRPDRERDAWDRLNRALILNPRHADALLLKAELLGRKGDNVGALAALREVAKVDPSASRDRLVTSLLADVERNVAALDVARAMSSLQEVAGLDAATVRPRLKRFLGEHPNLLGGRKFPPKQPRRRGPSRRWVLRSLMFAGLSVIVMSISCVVFAVATPTENGSLKIGDPRGIAYVVSLLGIVVVPVVVVVIGKLRSRGSVEAHYGADPLSVNDLIRLDDAPLQYLLEATNLILLRLAHPGISLDDLERLISSARDK